MNSSKKKNIEITSPLGELEEAKIAARAYEKWCQRGCPLWEEGQDWEAARAELEHEIGNVKTPVALNAQG